jgi:tRNA (guanosine-2'-O-)-methyltransferase
MDFSHFLPRLSPDRRRALAAELAAMVRPRRLARMDAVLAARTRHLALLCEDLYHPHNAGAVLRSAECFGLQDVHVVEADHRFRPSPRVTCGADRWLTLRRWPTLAPAAAHLRHRGYRLAATSLDPRSVPLAAAPLDRPLVLMLGTEETGLSPEALATADLHVHVPMVGFTRSLNVSVTAALCLQHLGARLRAEREDWPLGAAERAELRLSWLMDEGTRARALTVRRLREWGLVETSGTTPATGPPRFRADAGADAADADAADSPPGAP